MEEKNEEKLNPQAIVRHRVDPILKDYLKRRRNLNLKVKILFLLFRIKMVIRHPKWVLLQWKKIKIWQIFCDRSFSCLFQILTQWLKINSKSVIFRVSAIFRFFHNFRVFWLFRAFRNFDFFAFYAFLGFSRFLARKFKFLENF